MNITYKWQTIQNDATLKDLSFNDIRDDENWFKNEVEAIAWLQKQKELDESFGDDVFHLLKMYFV